MGRLLLVYVLIHVALIVVAIIECLSCDAADIRALPRVVWAFIIVLFAPLGPIAWFLAGRPLPATTPAGAAPSPSTAPSTRPRKRPVAPDDDPEFLKALGEPRTDEDLFKRWEEDLKRREGDLRRKEGEDPTKD